MPRPRNVNFFCRQTTAAMRQLAEVELRLVFGFLPQGTYLIYACVCREWRRVWILCGRARESSVKHFVANPRLLQLTGGAYIDDLIDAAVMHGSMNVIQGLFKKYRHRFAAFHAGDVMIRGDMNVILWFVSHDFGVDAHHEKAARHGHLHVLKWLGAEKMREQTMLAAIEGRHLEIMQWLHENGHRCTYDALWLAAWLGAEMFDGAARAGHVEALQWLHDRGVRGTEHVISWVIPSGHHRVVRWLHDHGYALPAAAFLLAITGHVTVPLLDCLHELLAPLSETVFERAVGEARSLDVLEWLRAHGCPWDSQVYVKAIVYGRTDILQ